MVYDANREVVLDNTINISEGRTLSTLHGSATQTSSTTSSSSSSSWHQLLTDISTTTISFPNGINHPNADNINGSPSDVDVRAALKLYNVVKVAAFKSGYKPLSKGEGVVFDIISDLGTHRLIDSVGTLANLMCVEIEKELAIDVDTSRHITTMNDGDTAEMGDNYTTTPINTINNTLQTNNTIYNLARTTFYNIRPSPQSGIIHLISTHRSLQLHTAGRLPCPNCTKWCKGPKGLWWHQLKHHGVDYGGAMELAAGSLDTLAVVRWEERRRDLFLGREGVNSKGGVSDAASAKENDENSITLDAFEFVKTGDIHNFIKLIENEKHNPITLDRNGATALHWAAGCGHVNIVSYLIEKCKCCPNQGQIGKRSFAGRTPLHWAARNGHLKVVEYLIERCNGAVDIEAKTGDGTTAFCWAAWQGHLDVMK